ncbi:MAG: inositol monophosphatase [Armatimonadetes bacterium]|nr:inositol monophosphatase [Armatimonadota bacterium]
MPRVLATYLDTARRAALEAGALIREHLHRKVLSRAKGHLDVVTEIDTRSEEIIRHRLLGDFPEHAFLGEEGGAIDKAGAPLWIVDPLDGTKNFIHGYPFVGVSIALEIEGQVRLAVVLDPMRDELFHAVRGGGAYLNGEQLQVSDTPNLEQSLLVTGFYGNTREFVELFHAVQERVQGVRRDGAATLDLCYVACGRFDAYWDLKLQPWDLAAGSLIIEEAGGMCTDLAGRPLDIRKPGVLCSNVRIHRQLLDLIGAYLAV